MILIVDVRGQAASAAAVLQGFAGHRAGVHVAGAVFNRVGSDRHAAILREACAATVPAVPVLGCLPRNAELALPERHLGLVQAGEHADLEAFLDGAAALIAEHVDWRALGRLARPWPVPANAAPPPPLPPIGQRIAVAVDAAFAFSYPSVIDGWRREGAEIVPFSPLAGAAPDAAADAVYLPGGYPQLHGPRLAAAGGFLEGLRRAAGRGATLFGECGGYMVLGRGIIDGDGARHAMAGLLPVETSFAERRLHLGYRRVRLAGDGPLGPAGRVFRGHEFHYASILEEGPAQPLFHCTDAGGQDRGAAGLKEGRVMGSFVHLIDREVDA